MPESDSKSGTRAATTKVCAVCGVSCAGQPRTRDKEGRYFHRICYDNVMAEKRRREAAGEADATQESGVLLDTAVADTNLSMLSQLDIEPAKLGDPSSFCVECGKHVDGDDVICTHCGADLSPEAAQTTKKKKQPRRTRRYGVEEVGGSLGAVVLGALSILVATVVGVVFLAALVGTVMLGVFESPEPRQLVVGIALPVIGVVLSTWLLLAGLDVLKQIEGAGRNIVRWAISATLVYTAVFLTVLGASTVIAELVQMMPLALELPSGEELIATVGLGTVIAYLVAVAWPVFTLYWLHTIEAVSE